ncbi:MAG TPA: pyrimidine 5'-nucleotidase [Burkholderiaceae bacterium]|nr:pyrimidine 5'-nucleotidase [Burkholderiaceae bacterium]
MSRPYPTRRKRSGPGVDRRLTALAGRRPVWLLDLDNTLHDTYTIMPRINRMMTEYVMRRLGIDEPAANELRIHYWRRYGATMIGMVRHHQVDHRDFLRETHNFPDLHKLIRRDPRLAHFLRRLPGRKIVLTNSPHAYASRVLAALGVAPLVDGLIAVERMRAGGHIFPKPSRPMLKKILARARLPAHRCVLVEDSIENLRSGRYCGLRTVLVSGITYKGSKPWGRPRRGQGGIDRQVRSVVQLARTPLACLHSAAVL